MTDSAHDPSNDLPEKFLQQVNTTTNVADWPLCNSVEQNALIYDARELNCNSPDARAAVKAEWCRALLEGPGVIAIKSAFDDTSVIDEATTIFDNIINAEKASDRSAADHFAKAGSNDRIWNALQKHCLQSPKNFATYYSNAIIATASEAWLGDGYQITAQVNRVNPGGAAQVPHRDYHLGFMATERMAKYPPHIHRLSPLLTLQGAIAHCDMPIETGPTLYLPYSQQYENGYLEFHKPAFQNYFSNHKSQLALQKGDAVFFNPALMHGAGTNKTKSTQRLANLLQVSSAFGIAMETIDRTQMLKTLYPILQHVDPAHCDAVIAAAAKGYAFPTNLDTDPPVDGMSPATQADITREAVAGNWAAATFNEKLDALTVKQTA